MSNLRRPEPRRPQHGSTGPADDRPLTPRERQELACRLRLADSRPQRWAWALGSSLPLVGLPVLIVHAVSRRTVLPTLFGISAVAMSAFATLTMVAALRNPADPPPPQKEAPLLLILGGMACFAIEIGRAHV